MFKGKFVPVNVYVKKKEKLVLADWLSWLEHCPIYQKAVGSVSSLGTCLGCRFDPWLGCIWKAMN